MATEKYFYAPSDSYPMLYIYEDTTSMEEKFFFIGYTTKNVHEHFVASYKGNCSNFRNVLAVGAMAADGSVKTDKMLINYLINKGYYQRQDGCINITKDKISSIIKTFINSKLVVGRVNSFGMRPEQQEAVSATIEYFNKVKISDPERTPSFLWNCKMRFGKTFASYQLVKKMGWKRILILTFKPAVESAWEEDLLSHQDFSQWQFVSCKATTKEPIYNKDFPLICFGSFQDLMGKNLSGGIKSKNEWVHLTNWDCVIFDEYHYGAWREGAKDLFENENSEFSNNGFDYFNQDLMPISTNHYLYLSGTPFRAISTGEFIEQQIFNWTYSDEQRAKLNWIDSLGENPYLSLPRVIMLTYKIPEEIRSITEDENGYFDLNEFFSTKGSGKNAEFCHKEYVQEWIDFICGKYRGGIYNEIANSNGLRMSAPFSNQYLMQSLKHTFWFLPKVDSCFAMYNLLREEQNSFFEEYNIIIAAGNQAGMGVDAINPVKEAMGMPDPLSTKTITLSCGKLTTGVTIKPWTGIFILRNLNSPETYFQAAFRVQSPWTIKNFDGRCKGEEILKKDCYVLDFSPNRALKQIADYSCRLSLDEDNPEKKVYEFIQYMPILSYEDGKFMQMSSESILDVSLSGTSATLLARRWESARLVNVDDDTLKRLLNNPAALEALQKIEGFRNLNSDIESIINKGETIKKAKKSGEKKSKKLTEEENEYKSLRKQLQEKLIRFAARIPVFLYLTDYREKCLKDVILKIEPTLFKKVTALEIEDFDLLLSLGVFNSQLMNDAIYKFKQYEDSSLEYSGLCMHQKGLIGGFDTVITYDEYQSL